MNKEIFIHVGFHKTATTYLQNAIFPYFKNTDYLHGLRSIKDLILLTEKEKLLISHESFQGSPVRSIPYGPQGWIASRLQRINMLSNLFPTANIIVAMRSHGEWLSSMYRQYLHQGGLADYDNFFSVREDLLVERAGLFYEQFISELKLRFSGRIFCINYEGFKKDSGIVLNAIEEFVGEQLVDDVKVGIFNPSVKGSQAKLLRWANRFIEPLYDEPRSPIFKRKGILWKLGLTPNYLIRHMKFLGRIGADVVPVEKIEEANIYYKSDWRWVERNVGEYVNEI